MEMKILWALCGLLLGLLLGSVVGFKFWYAMGKLHTHQAMNATIDKLVKEGLAVIHPLRPSDDGEPPPAPTTPIQFARRQQQKKKER